MNDKVRDDQNTVVREFDLVIVGGGIVGCSLALAAARALSFSEEGLSGTSARKKSSSRESSTSLPQAITIALIEASEPSSNRPSDIDDKRANDKRTNDRYTLEGYDPRVVALSPESQAFLKQLGVWPAIEDKGLCAYQFMDVWDGEGTGNIRFEAEELRRDSLGCIVENRTVIASLYEQLHQQANVEIFRGTRVSGLALADESLCEPGYDSSVDIFTDGNVTFKSRLVVAADGAKSKVRSFAGIDTREWGYNQSAIVCTVKTEQVHEYTAWQRFTQHGPLAFLPLHSVSRLSVSGPSIKKLSTKGLPLETKYAQSKPLESQGSGGDDSGEDKYSSIVWSLDSALAEEKMLLDDESFCADLSRAFEYRLGKVEVASTRYSFPLVQCHAKTYFKPGVVLVGDAAHAIHPLAGQGVNLGLADAKILSAEIIRAGERRFLISDTSVLKRYQRQCQTRNLAAMSAMEFFKRFYGSDNLVLRYLRNRGMSFCDKQDELKKILAELALGRAGI